MRDDPIVFEVQDANPAHLTLTGADASRDHASTFSWLVAVTSRWGWLLVILWLGAVYALDNLVLPGALPAGVYMHLAHPLIWCSLGALAYLCWRHGLEERPAFSRVLILTALLIGAAQISLLTLTGLLAGFGESPYGHRFLTIMGNLWYVGSMLVGMEMSRAYLAAAIGRRSSLVALLLTTLLFTAASIPMHRYRLLEDARSALEMGGVTLLPTISANLLASLLALLGGPVASLSYLGVLQAFEWLSPILPDPPWIVTALVGTVAPILGLLVVYYRFLDVPDEETATTEKRKHRSAAVWVIVALLAVMVLWFNTGLLGVQPTLVSGRSMSPALEPGDVVITHDVPPEEIQAGDIIRFQQHGVPVLHRVAEIHETDGQREFITRGDANNADDEPVRSEILEGKVILVVPKIGWVSIGVREMLSWLGIG